MHMSRIFVGTYDRLGGKGIAELTDGKVVWESSVSDPSYLAADPMHNRLYAVSEGKTSYVAAWDITGRPRFLNRLPTNGNDACHLSVSGDGRFLYAANYGNGVLDVFSVNETGIVQCVQSIRHSGHGEDPTRQEGPHGHCAAITPDDRYLCFCDLGLDTIFVYRRDAQTGLLTEVSKTEFRGGDGVRHIAFMNDTAFCAHEMGNKISKLTFKEDKLELQMMLPVLPGSWKGKSYCAAIRCDGNFVYVTNRGRNTVCVFDLDGAPIHEWSVYGDWPRDLLLMGDGTALCACQQSGTVTRISLADGSLLEEYAVPGAVSVIRV